MFEHTPVLLDEVLAALAVRPDGIYVDGTVGGGGHSDGIARSLSPAGRLVGIDQDPAALAAAATRLLTHGERVQLVRGNFARLDQHLAQLGIAMVDGILLDLGVSSPQLDETERGFSYHREAPLDMRMDPAAATTAADLVATLPEAELARVLREYGEERFARRIARAIVQRRERQPLRTTTELADLVRGAIPAPARREPQHPARRTFQALRIAVNAELDVLRTALAVALPLLAPDGRLAVISFHSLEDRIVKHTFMAWAKGCICPPHLPICICGQVPSVRIPGRQPITAGDDEVARNPRARSAKLRYVAKLAVAPAGA